MADYYEYYDYGDEYKPPKTIENNPSLNDSLRFLSSRIGIHVSEQVKRTPDNLAEFNRLRMTVNQITFAILISILLVADTFLVWCLGYLVIYFESRGRLALKHYSAIKLFQFCADRSV